jgi:hypothetical protein
MSPIAFVVSTMDLSMPILQAIDIFGPKKLKVALSVAWVERSFPHVVRAPAQGTPIPAFAQNRLVLATG